MRIRRAPNRSTSPPGGRSAGLTLYEVVLAMTIFLLAMAAISQIIRTGSRASIQAKLETDAAILAETKMGEVVAGAVSLTDGEGGQISADDPYWNWNLAVANANIDGLKDVTVTVNHLGQDGQPDATYSIRRLVRDPQIYIDAALEAEQQAAEAESGSGGTTP